MMPALQYSRAGLELTKGFESCRLMAYPDSKGVPTIGYGHTAGVSLGMTCTQAEADAWLLADIQTAVAAINRLVCVSLTQPEFDALVDLVFNIGQGNFASSTILRLLNAGDYSGAAMHITDWDVCGGHVLAGLLRRRQAETSEFEGKS